MICGIVQRFPLNQSGLKVQKFPNFHSCKCFTCWHHSALIWSFSVGAAQFVILKPASVDLKKKCLLRSFPLYVCVCVGGEAEIKKINIYCFSFTHK